MCEGRPGPRAIGEPEEEEAGHDPVAWRLRTASASHRQLEDFDQLADAWDRLARKSGSPIEVHLGEGVRGGAERSIQPVRAGGRTTDQPIAIAPLAGGDVPWRPWSCSVSTSSGSRWTSSTPMPPRPPPWLRFLPSCRVPLRLKRFPSHSFGLAAVGIAYRKRGLDVLSREARACLASDWTSPTGTTATSSRPVRPSAGPKKSAAARRRELRGALSRAGELQPLMDQALDVEAAGWKGRARTALVHDSTRQAFFRAMRRQHRLGASCGSASCESVTASPRCRSRSRPAAASGCSRWATTNGSRAAPRARSCCWRPSGTRHCGSCARMSSSETPSRGLKLLLKPREVRPCVHLETYPFKARGVGGLATGAAAMGGRRLRDAIRSRR